MKQLLDAFEQFLKSNNYIFDLYYDDGDGVRNYKIVVGSKEFEVQLEYTETFMIFQSYMNEPIEYTIIIPKECNTSEEIIGHLEESIHWVNSFSGIYNKVTRLLNEIKETVGYANIGIEGDDIEINTGDFFKQ